MAFGGSVVENSIVPPGAVVGKNCRLAGTIVNSRCQVPDGTVIDASCRRSASPALGEPIVLTTEDFTRDGFSATA